ncbi:MAG: hypothetical protein WDN28_07740 [Chthoniobacter sp.]
MFWRPQTAKAVSEQVGEPKGQQLTVSQLANRVSENLVPKSENGVFEKMALREAYARAGNNVFSNRTRGDTFRIKATSTIRASDRLGHAQFELVEGIAPRDVTDALRGHGTPEARQWAAANGMLEPVYEGTERDAAARRQELVTQAVRASGDESARLMEQANAIKPQPSGYRLTQRGTDTLSSWLRGNDAGDMSGKSEGATAEAASERPAPEATAAQRDNQPGASTEPVPSPGKQPPLEAREPSPLNSTSTKNAVMDAERTARNASPIIREAKQSNADTFAKAEGCD